MKNNGAKDIRRTHLFIDREGIDEIDGISFNIEKPRSEGLALSPEKEWEAYRISPIAVHEDNGLCRMWYSAVACYPGAGHPVSCPRCGRENPGSKVVCVGCGWPVVDIDYLQNKMVSVCYAESTDGIRWERPELGLVDFRGSKRNNLISGPCGVPALNPKADAQRRYMGIIEHQRELYLATSPDGLRWSRDATPCLPFVADTNNQIMYDPETDRYIALLRGFPGRRTTVCCEIGNVDETPWPFEEHGHKADKTGCRYITDELPTVLDIDVDDPPLAGLDINHISAHRYETGAWFGYPALYRKYPPVGLDREGREEHRFFAQGNDGAWETQLAVSRDGRHWARPDRSCYLGPGIFGDLDGGINSVCGVGVIRRGAEIFQYGSGQSVTHGMFEPGERRGAGAVYRFSQKRDRFIAAVAGTRGGRLLMTPFESPGGELTLNIDCGGLGEASVELRDASGSQLPGFTHQDCDRVDLNHLDHRVTWRGKSTRTLPHGLRIGLEIRMHSARLYALSFTKS